MAFLPATAHGACRRLLLLGATLMASWSMPASANSDVQRTALLDLPIEQLLTMEVYSASKFVQKLGEAPSAVSVVTAADIKAFGWRTLADILASMRGLYISNDRNYTYLGARGFLRSGDYNSRFLLLVDGNRNNDAIYDQASIGSEFVLDVDLIERVEYVPGPGSSIYGANAFFGVINVITKSGRGMRGPQVAVEAGSHGTQQARFSYGMRNSDGNELLLSATAFRRNGRDLYFSEFDTPAENNGIARGRDHDRADSLFIKGGLGPFSLSIAHSERTKGVPTASYDQVFNDPRAHTVDAQSFVDLGHRVELAPQTELVSRLYWGSYDYDGDYAYDVPPLGLNRDVARARWYGVETRATSTRIDRHKLVVGAEYQHDYRRDQSNFDVDPYDLFLDDRRQGWRWGVYIQDEVLLRDDLILNAGFRYDRNATTGGTFNPRLGLIYKAAESTTLKALYGTAFRAPNAYELYYDLQGPGGQKANPALGPERIRTFELSAEHYVSADTRLTGSLFHTTVSDLISQRLDPADDLLEFRNLDRVVARGIEMELEKTWSGGTRLRTSLALQRSQDTVSQAEPANSPRQLAKMNLSTPVLDGRWRAGIEARYIGSRRTRAAATPGYWLANLTLSSIHIAPGVEASASIYNLFDQRYADPGGEEHRQDAIIQDGRSVRVRMTWSF